MSSFFLFSPYQANTEDPYIASRTDLAVVELDDSFTHKLQLHTMAGLEEALMLSMETAETIASPPTLPRDAAISPLVQRLRLCQGPLGSLIAATHAQVSHVQALTIALDNIQAYGGIESKARERVDAYLAAMEDKSDKYVRTRAAEETVGFLSVQAVKIAARKDVRAAYAKHSGNRKGQDLADECAAMYAWRTVEELEIAAVRAQLAHLVLSMREVLSAFPSTRDYHFLPGNPHQAVKKARAKNVVVGTARQRLHGAQQLGAGDTAMNDDGADGRAKNAQSAPASGSGPAPGGGISNPLQILSDDGQLVENLWYGMRRLFLSVSLLEEASLSSRPQSYRSFLIL